MFPYKDENPTILTPVVTVGIIAANLAAWLFVQGAGTNEAVVADLISTGSPSQMSRAGPDGDGHKAVVTSAEQSGLFSSSAGVVGSYVAGVG